MASWINLSKYGIDFKKVQLSNGKLFPVAIITDMEKYISSGATPLDQLEKSGSGFSKLPGERKGRAFNTPILYLTTPYNPSGVSDLKILHSIAKLLNTSRDVVDSLKADLPDEIVKAENGFADFNKLNAILQDATQAYYGNILYLPKKQHAPMALADYVSDLVSEQHALFPKASPLNLPLETLHNFGLDSSIFKKAFLNPQDAKKQGFDLVDLEPININGETTILPVSINKDLSLNIILDAHTIPQLAYSNYNWSKNTSVINDYNALLSLKENSRDCLNARPSVILSASDMERHLENMSLSLRNFQSVNGFGNTNKGLKLPESDKLTLLTKNSEGDWRIYQKSYGFKKDEPLTWDNYKQLITVLVDQNLTLTAAMNEKNRSKSELNSAVEMALKNHAAIYKSFVAVIDSNSEKIPDNKILINLNGSKISNNQVRDLESSFDRDLGQSLYTESVKSVINAMQIEGGTNISEQVGSNVATIDEIESVTSQVGPSASVGLDVGLDALNSGAQSDKIKITVNPMIDSELPQTQSSNNIEKYLRLPKGIGKNIDDKYDEFNDIYRTLQYIELGAIPFLKQLKSKVDDIGASKDLEVIDVFVSAHKGYLEGASSPIVNLDSSIQNDEAGLIGLSSDISNAVTREQIKANILKYQLSKQLIDQDIPVKLLSVINSVDGVYAPFESTSDQSTASGLVSDKLVGEIAQLGHYPAIDTEINEKLNSFVSSHYSYKVQSLANDELVRNSLLYVGSSISIDASVPDYELPLNPTDRKDLYFELSEITGSAILKFAQAERINGISGYSALDDALIEVAKLSSEVDAKTGFENSLGFPQSTVSVLDQYKGVNLSDFFTIPSKVAYDPDYSTPLSNLTKLNILNELNFVSLTEQQLALDELMGQVDFANKNYNVAATKIFNSDLSNSTNYIAGVAGQFLVNNQTINSANSNSKEFVIGDFGEYTVTPKSTDANGIALKSNSYESALNEAFAIYQLNRISSDLGMPKAALSTVMSIVQDVQAGQGVSLPKLGSIVKQTLGERHVDLMDIDVSTSKTDQYKDFVYINGREINELTPRDSHLIKAAIGCVSVLTSTPTTVQYPGLIDSLGPDRFADFHKIQAYLTPNNQEKIHILKESENASSPDDLSELVSFYAEDAYKKLLSSGSIIYESNSALSIATPTNSSTPIHARVIDENWASLKNINQTDPSDNLVVPVNINLSPREILSDIREKFAIGIDSSLAGFESTPYPINANLAVPYSEFAFTDNQALINKPYIEVVTPENINSIKIEIAKASFEAAINNMDANLKDKLNKDIKSGEFSSEPVRISVMDRGESVPPAIRIDPPNSEVETGFKSIATLEIGFLARHILSNNGSDDIEVLNSKSSDTLAFYEKLMDVAGVKDNGLREAISGIATYDHQPDYVETKNEEPLIEASYLELLNCPTMGDVSLMSPSEISEKIKLDKIWPDAPLMDHVRSGNQNIDTVILSRMIKDLLPHGPTPREDRSLNGEASIYAFTVSEFHKAISASRNSSELLVNFNQAYSNVTKMDPTYIKDISTHSETLALIKKAAHSHDVKGVDVKSALMDSIGDDRYAAKYIEAAVLSIAKNEKLLDGEKSFIHHMDGFTLNEKASGIDARVALSARFADDRDHLDFNFESLPKTSPALSKDVVDSIDAISRLDFKETASIGDIESKWNANITIPADLKIFSQGSIKAIDSFLEEFSTKHNIDLKDGLLKGVNIVAGPTVEAVDGSIVIEMAKGDLSDAFEKNSRSFVHGVLTTVLNQEIAHLSKNIEDKIDPMHGANYGLYQAISDGLHSPVTDAARQISDMLKTLKHAEMGIEKASPVDLLMNSSSIGVISRQQKFDAEYESGNYGQTGLYYGYLHDNALDKQKSIFSQIEDKIKKIAEKNHESTDLYAFNSINQLFEKASTPSLAISKVAVDKFIALEHPRVSSSQIDQIKSEINEDAYLVGLIKDHLSSKAADFVIQKMVEHTKSMPNITPEVFVSSLNSSMPSVVSASSSDYNPVYLSNFASNLEANSIKHYARLGSYEKDYEYDNKPVSDDRILIEFVDSALSNRAKLNEGEKVLIVNTLEKVLTSLPEIKKHFEKERDLNEDLNQSRSLEI